MLIALLFACRPGKTLTEEQLRDPAQCEECHPAHVSEWEGSMHAYAAEDPVFLAMNAKGQRETDGELGDFCLSCHAPLAVELGFGADGTLDDVPEELRGVTCAFCHSVEAVEGTHNNPLKVASDLVIRGGIREPLDNTAHASAWSPLHDGDEVADSSSMCGSCHDIVTPLGSHIERTFLEWQESVFATPTFGVGCTSCHMAGRDGVAAKFEGAATRRVHAHDFPAVDVALTDFPDREEQRAKVQEALDDVLFASLCVIQNGDAADLLGTLENVASGHFFPSGATADRRAWVEIHAFRDEAEVFVSGHAPDGRIGKLEDPYLWSMWSTLLDESGAPTHDFWDAADIEIGGLLPTALDPKSPDFVPIHKVSKTWSIPVVPDRVTFAVHLQPIGLEILDELVEEGDLAPEIRDAMPTFTLAPTVLEWTAATANEGGCVDSQSAALPAR